MKVPRRSVLVTAGCLLVLAASCTPGGAGGGSTTTSVPDTTTSTAPETTTTSVPDSSTTTVPDTTTTTAVTDTTTTSAPDTTTTTLAGPPPTGGTSLLLPSSAAFAVLGASCGGIQEQAFATGFDTATGSPTGDVYLQTKCGGSGRGGGYHVTTYSAWVGVTWDFSGVATTYSKLSGTPGVVSPAVIAMDPAGAVLYNTLSAINVSPANCAVGNTTYCTYRAYLYVAAPAMPTGISAIQVGDQFAVAWMPDPQSAPLITSSTITATPVGSTAPVLTATVSGAAATGSIGPLQPLTTYEVTVANTDAGGSGPAGDPVTVSTPVSTVVPSAPTTVSGSWAGAGTLAASWGAANAGDSPTDQYRITATPHDADPPAPAPVTQTVSGDQLSTTLAADSSFSWSVQVQAHDAAGWGQASTPIIVNGL